MALQEILTYLVTSNQIITRSGSSDSCEGAASAGHVANVVKKISGDYRDKVS